MPMLSPVPTVTDSRGPPAVPAPLTAVTPNSSRSMIELPVQRVLLAVSAFFTREKYFDGQAKSDAQTVLPDPPLGLTASSRRRVYWPAVAGAVTESPNGSGVHAP